MFSFALRIDTSRLGLIVREDPKLSLLEAGEGVGGGEG